MKNREPNPNGHQPSADTPPGTGSPGTPLKLSGPAERVLRQVFSEAKLLADEGGELVDLAIVYRGRLKDGQEYPFLRYDADTGWLMPYGLLTWAARSLDAAIATPVPPAETEEAAAKGEAAGAEQRQDSGTATPEVEEAASPSEQDEAAAPSGQGEEARG